MRHEQCRYSMESLMPDNFIHVVLVCDDRYVRHAAATIISIVKNSHRKFHFYIFDCGIASENIEILKAWNLEGSIVQIVPMQKIDIFEKFGLPPHFSSSIFYRVAIPNVLNSLEKCIFIDSDVVVTKDIEYLWEQDLQRKLMGIVYSEGNFLTKDSLKKYKTKIGLPEDKRYFYSGLMVMNLKELRAYNLLGKVVGFLTNHQKELICPEQDILNIILDRQDLLELPAEWNFTPFSPLSKKHNLKTLPATIHYSVYKPWNFPYPITKRLPCRFFQFINQYYHYAFLTPFGHLGFPEASYKQVVRVIYKSTFQPIERKLKNLLK